MDVASNEAYCDRNQPNKTGNAVQIINFIVRVVLNGCTLVADYQIIICIIIA